MKKSTIGIGVAIAMISSAWPAPLIRIALGYGIAPSVIAMYRLGFTAIICGIIFAFDKEARAEAMKLKRREFLLILLSSVFFALHYITWISSLNLTSTFVSMALLSVSPLFAIAGGYLLFREKVEKKALIGVAVAIVGVLLVALFERSKGGGGSFVGGALSLISAFCVSSYFLIGRYSRRNIGTMLYMGLLCAMASAFLAVFSLASGAPMGIYSAQAFFIFLALAACTMFGHAMYNYLMKYISSSTVTVASLSESVGASILTFLIFGETVSVFSMIGGAIILLGVGWYMRCGMSK